MEYSIQKNIYIAMGDEDGTSRDSGICEMMDENTPVNFSSFITRTSSEESMDVEESNSRPGKILLRREKSSCQVRLFDTSPNTPVAPRPTLLVLRDLNRQGRDNGFQESDQTCLKRLWVPYNSEFEKMAKMSKRNESLHYKTENADGGDDDEEFMLETEKFHESQVVEMDEMGEAETSTESIPIRGRSPIKKSPTVFARPMAKGFRCKNAGISIHRLNVDKVKPIDMELAVECQMETESDENSLPREYDRNSIEDYHLVVKYSLPPVQLGSSSCFRRINAETLTQLLMDNPGEAFLQKYALIDCRYPFEFEGGHVKHAINFYDYDNAHVLFQAEKKRPQQRILIFYCEYSQKRGPSMANALRRLDRFDNFGNYPNVFFPEMYVLDKGYKGFFRETRQKPTQELCTPNSYVEMNHPDYTDILRTFTLHKRLRDLDNLSRRTLFVAESPTQFGRSDSVSEHNSPPTPRNLNLDITSP
uniref:protein-tyrosine-phosphatase n=1 Tax=Caenorhabditis tropicalis TaxID=1561998 RepID=A0A1I7SXL8_9PELO